jgi:hypothetical protein
VTAARESRAVNSPALTAFGRRGSPNAISLVIARALPGSEVKRTASGFRVNVGDKRSVFAPVKPHLVIDIDGNRFTDADADRAREDLRSFLVRRVRGPGLDAALQMIPDLQVAMSFVPLDPDHGISSGDRIFHVALDAASRTEGFLFDVRHGRLYSMTGEVWASTEQLLADGGAPFDPSLARLHGRLVTLVAVAARALTEYDGRDLDEAHHGIQRWVRSVGAGAEVEPGEQLVLDAVPTAIDDAVLAEATWRLEGAVVLAWALHLVDRLPPFDESTDPMALSSILRFPEGAATREVLKVATRRHQALIDAEAERHRSIRWRLHDFAAHPQALELASFIGPDGQPRFGHVPVLDGDLAVGGRPIAEADPQAVEIARAITDERLRALHWLQHGGPYSATKLGS